MPTTVVETLTLTVQLPLAATVPPVRLIVPVFAAAVTVPPVQVVVAAGVAEFSKFVG